MSYLIKKNNNLPKTYSDEYKNFSYSELEVKFKSFVLYIINAYLIWSVPEQPDKHTPSMIKSEFGFIFLYFE